MLGIAGPAGMVAVDEETNTDDIPVPKAEADDVAVVPGPVLVTERRIPPPISVPPSLTVSLKASLMVALPVPISDPNAKGDRPSPGVIIAPPAGERAMLLSPTADAAGPAALSPARIAGLRRSMGSA